MAIVPDYAALAVSELVFNLIERKAEQVLHEVWNK